MAHVQPDYEEWWTLKQVCGYLHVHRATVHRWRQIPEAEFPKGAEFGFRALRFRAADVKEWARSRVGQRALDAFALTQPSAG